MDGTDRSLEFHHWPWPDCHQSGPPFGGILRLASISNLGQPALIPALIVGRPIAMIVAGRHPCRGFGEPRTVLRLRLYICRQLVFTHGGKHIHIPVYTLYMPDMAFSSSSERKSSTRVRPSSSPTTFPLHVALDVGPSVTLLCFTTSTASLHVIPP